MRQGLCTDSHSRGIPAPPLFTSRACAYEQHRLSTSLTYVRRFCCLGGCLSGGTADPTRFLCRRDVHVLSSPRAGRVPGRRCEAAVCLPSLQADAEELLRNLGSSHIPRATVAGWLRGAYLRAGAGPRSSAYPPSCGGGLVAEGPPQGARSRLRPGISPELRWRVVALVGLFRVCLCSVQVSLHEPCFPITFLVSWCKQSAS